MVGYSIKREPTVAALVEIRKDIAALEFKMQRSEEKTKNKIMLSKKQQEAQAANTTPAIVVSDVQDVSPSDYDPTAVPMGGTAGGGTGLETPSVAATATAPTYEDVYATKPTF